MKLNIITNDERFDVEVVGESFYQENIASIYNAPNRIFQNGLVFANAILFLDDDNPHDNEAVGVTINGLLVGYLESCYAGEFREIFADYLIEKQIATRAEIQKFPNNYSITLDFSYDDECYINQSDILPLNILQRNHNQSSQDELIADDPFQEKENMGCLLSLGVIGFPFLFSLIVGLSPRYKNSTRIIALVWLIINIWIIISVMN